LLKLIANDCFAVNDFLFSAKAFELLEELDHRELGSQAMYAAAKLSACVGVVKNFTVDRADM